MLGKGFVLEPEEAQRLIERDPRNRDVLNPYLNGDDVNSRPDQSPSRWVINFHDWPLDEEWDRMQRVPKGPPYAVDYPDCLAIIEEKVRPERQRWQIDKDGKEIVGTYALRSPLPERWWHYADKRPALYRSIEGLERVLVVPVVSRYTVFTFASNTIVYMHKLAVFPSASYCMFSVLSSSIHHHWSWKYSSTLGSNSLNYSPSDCFETFPIPVNISEMINLKLDEVGQQLFVFRNNLLKKLSLGITKAYNQFNNSYITNTNIAEICRNNNVYANIYGKDTMYLWQHLNCTPDSCSFDEAVQGIIRLRELQKEMDNAVLTAYGWDRDSVDGPAIDLAHDFYEVEYLPETDRVRYTISPEARKEVLKRLLKLNHRIREEEASRE